MNAVTQDFGPCPCGETYYASPCRMEGTKLTRFGHLVGCKCPSCTGRRNKRKGQAAEARAHKRLGGTGPTVRDDLFHCYSVNLSVETKTGATNIPAKLLTAARSEWVRHALGQAIKKTPVGSDALPTIALEVSPSEAYLIVDVSGRSLR